MQVFRDYRLIECETTMRRLTPIAIREVAVFDTEEVVPVVHAHWIDQGIIPLTEGYSGYGLHVFMEGPKQGTNFEFNALMVGLSPCFLFAGAMMLIILIIS